MGSSRYLSATAARALRPRKRRRDGLQLRSALTSRDHLVGVLRRVLEFPPLPGQERIHVSRALLVDCLTELAGS